MAAPEHVIDDLAAFMSMAAPGYFTDRDVDDAADLLERSGAGELSFDVITMAERLIAAGFDQAPGITGEQFLSRMQNVQRFTDLLRARLLTAVG